MDFSESIVWNVPESGHIRKGVILIFNFVDKKSKNLKFIFRKKITILILDKN